MKVKFNNKDVGNAEMLTGDFETMLKMRKEKLGEIQAKIQETLADYDGGSIAIIVMKEDENGLPRGSQILMAGTSRPEVQIEMGRALTQSADQMIETILASAGGDPRKLLRITSQLVKFMEGGK